MRQQSGRTQPARRNEVLQPSKRTPAPTRPLGQWPSRDLETTVGTEPNPPVERGASAIEADASSNAAIATMALPGSRDYSRDGTQPARRTRCFSHRSGRQLQRGHCDSGPPGISRLQSGRRPTRPSKRGASAIEADAPQTHPARRLSGKS
jgi:hypothetical protein